MHTAFSLQIANAALQQQMHAIASEEINEDRGDLLISHSTPMPEEIRRRLLNRAFQWISAEPYPPRWSALIDLEVEVTAGQTRSLSGCLVTRQDTDWRICREFNAVRDTVGATQDVWDNRWQLTGPHAPDLQIRALGESVNSCPNWRETGLPRASLRASPAVFRGETLIAAPLAGYNPDWSAKIVASFTTYLLSH